MGILYAKKEFELFSVITIIGGIISNISIDISNEYHQQC